MDRVSFPPGDCGDSFESAPSMGSALVGEGDEPRVTARLVCIFFMNAIPCFLRKEALFAEAWLECRWMRNTSRYIMDAHLEV